MADGPEVCSTCRAERTSAPGGYCAPLRCYCGHPTCPAYPSWLRAKAEQRLLHAQQAAERTEVPPASPGARLAARAAAAAAKAHRQAASERQARAGPYTPHPWAPE